MTELADRFRALHDPSQPTASYRETIQFVEFELATAQGLELVDEVLQVLRDLRPLDRWVLARVVDELSRHGDRAALLAWLEAAGIAGFGQSSWGPTGFAIVASGLQQCLTDGEGIDSVDVKKMEKLFLSLA